MTATVVDSIESAVLDGHPVSIVLLEQITCSSCQSKTIAVLLE